VFDARDSNQKAGDEKGLIGGALIAGIRGSDFLIPPRHESIGNHRMNEITQDSAAPHSTQATGTGPAPGPAVKIYLIRPSIVVPRHNITIMFTPPLGLAYVAGTLQEASYEIDVIDAVGESLNARHPYDNDCFPYGLSPQQTIDCIDPDTDIIGVGADFPFEWPSCQELIALIRGRFPHALLIGGGEHVTAMLDQSPDRLT
jgi:hypothetical protein